MKERDITPLLKKAHEGDAEAMEEIARRVHSDLVRLAGAKMYGKFGGQATTLEPSDLVSETFMKLLEQRNEIKNSEHFFAIATKIMLRVLADYAKARNRNKRGGSHKVMVTLAALATRGEKQRITAIHDLTTALERLELHDARSSKVFKLREIWGLSSQEVADTLGVSKSTVDRDWRFARAWLRTHLESGGESG